MAWAEEKDSGFRITGFTQGANSILGKVRVSIDDICNREVLAVDGINYPGSRPQDEIDGRVVCQFVGLDSEVSFSASAANATVSFTAADGGSGSLVYGKVLAGSVVSLMGRRMGGFNSEQTFELEGARTKTWSL